ncbi:hypothetical protein [Streptomyces sp. NPDC127197]|uniref:hypothetical protein n=1 Tax=Streptomyces sp. NPDC127197 TaxID=3345388 RepID=UPI0036365D0B
MENDLGRRLLDELDYDTGQMRKNRFKASRTTPATTLHTRVRPCSTAPSTAAGLVTCEGIRPHQRAGRAAAPGRPAHSICHGRTAVCASAVEPPRAIPAVCRLSARTRDVSVIVSWPIKAIQLSSVMAAATLGYGTDRVLPHEEGLLMIPRFHSYVNESLEEYLRDRLNLPLDFDQLNVKHVAVVAAASSEDFAATGHLLSLLSVLPTPADDEFWRALWDASGDAYLLPANLKHLVLRALDGDAAGLAGQIMSAFEAMNPTNRAAVADLVGDTLASGIDLSFSKQLIGGLWLSDLERTAWRVLLATYTPTKSAEQAQNDLREAWKDA